MANPVQTIKDLTQDKKRDAVVNLIYSKIDSLLGGGPTGQFFCMEFPARPLNLHQFEYDTDNRNSVVSKPFAVSDSEFRMVDDLFNLAPIVQGPNGNKLSVVFFELVNNYVPKLKELHDFITDKANVRDWLLAQVEDSVDGQTFKGSRMELCKRLYALYLKGKDDWDEQKTTEYDRRKQADDLDGFADWLSRTAMVKDQELNNLFNDAVVRGYYHEVLTFLGFLNVCSSAEALETTKQNARNSSRRSLDESMDVMPVQLQPNNWFKAAAPNLSPKDLTMAADIVIAQYQAKRKEIEQLQAYLVQLEGSAVSKADVDKANAAVEAGRAKFQEAEAGLVKSYGDGAVGLVKIYLNAQTGGMTKAVGALSTINREDPAAKKLGLDQVAQDVVDGVLKTYKTNQAYLDSASQLAQLRARAADAAAHDYLSEITRTKQRIDSLQTDVRYLANLSSGVLSTENQPKATEELPVLPSSQNVEEADGMFMDVIVSSSDSADASNSSSASQASHSSWGVSLWVGSVGHQSSSESASSSVETAAINSEFTIGFRVAKVSLDRGGWFNPSLFEMSSGFQRIAQGMQASPRTIGASGEADKPLNKQTVLDVLKDPSTAATALQSLLKNNEGVPYMLPAYPMGFVIAKDITIRIKTSSADSSLSEALASQSSSTGGGFLCFSASSASSSKSTSESSYHGSHGDYTYIRIPGPQILGWLLQITPSDNSTRYEAMDKALLEEMRMNISDALNRVEPQDGATGKEKPAPVDKVEEAPHNG
jgi:hypothetical protein